jgi:hypothetical protein
MTGGTVNSTPSGFDELERRLLRVEKQNRRMKQLGAALLVLVTSLAVMGQVPSKKTVEANEFVLRDDSGNIRARLFMTAKTTTSMTIPGMDTPMPVTLNPKAALALYDEKGDVGGVLDDGSLSFIKSHVSLGGGILSIGDQNAGVVISPYSVGLFDEQGFETTLGRRALVTPRTGETQMRSAASLIMFDKNKNVIWKAP